VRMERIGAMFLHPAPNPYHRNRSTDAVAWAHNAAGTGDTTWEHEPRRPLVRRRRARRSALTGMFLQNDRLADGL
jgi:hypothetical protein